METGVKKNFMTAEGERLARIETRVDGMYAEMRSMRKLMERQIRVEEQYAHMAESIQRMESKLERLQTRMDEVERSTHQNHWTISRWERYLWLATTSGLGLIIWFIKTGVGA